MLKAYVAFFLFLSVFAFSYDLMERSSLVPPDNSIANQSESGTKGVEYTYSLGDGWNLISSPYAENISFSSLSDQVEFVYVFRDGLWIKNPDTIYYGEGFWARTSNNISLAFFSTKTYKPDLENLNEGWNLLGSGEILENILELDSIISLFSYDAKNSKWNIDPSTINPAEGFWVRATNTTVSSSSSTISSSSLSSSSATSSSTSSISSSSSEVSSLSSSSVTSSSSSSSSSLDYSGYSWLEYLNYLRNSTGMISLKESSLLNQAAKNHSDYLNHANITGHYENDSSNPYYSGYSPQDRVHHVGYDAYMGENISFGNRDYFESIDNLMSAIYHRFGFLSFGIDEVGVGSSGGTYTYNMGNSILDELCKGSSASYGYYGVCKNSSFYILPSDYEGATIGLASQNSDIVFWPPPDMVDIPPVFYEESPDPLPDYSVSGYPISIQFNHSKYSSATLSGFRLFEDEENLEILNTRLLDKSSDPSAKFDWSEYALFPLERLDWGKWYRVVVSIEGTTKSWRFKTRDLNIPYLQVDSAGTYNLNVISGKEYAIYFKPLHGTHTMGGYYTSYSYSTECLVDFIDNHTFKIKVNGDSGKYCKLSDRNGYYVINLTISASESGF